MDLPLIIVTLVQGAVAALLIAYLLVFLKP